MLVPAIQMKLFLTGLWVFFCMSFFAFDSSSTNVSSNSRNCRTRRALQGNVFSLLMIIEAAYKINEAEF